MRNVFVASSLADASVVRNHAESEEGEDWQCPACGEANPSSFAVCWNCAALQP
jgi:hypothetical protein